MKPSISRVFWSVFPLLVATRRGPVEYRTIYRSSAGPLAQRLLTVELLAKYAFGESVTKRLSLYEKYLSVRDKSYIDWSINELINWKQEEPCEKLVHIQGEKDPVFPIENCGNCIHVPNGTHTMIIHRAKWFNENLPTIILE